MKKFTSIQRAKGLHNLWDISIGKKFSVYFKGQKCRCSKQWDAGWEI